METPLIELRGVTKRFNEKTVLDGMNLNIYENQITTIIGKSGSGKSVLLKHIIGLLSPDEGTIRFRKKPVNEMSKKEWDKCRMQISYMFQNNALFDSMTVFENVSLPLRKTTNLKKKEIEKKVMSRLDKMELSDFAYKYPAELSGGMQKRVALARALVTDPTIVLFDEPTTGQDPIRKNLILSMIAHYRKQFGFTAVLVSHDIPDVFFVSDRILLLSEGKIAFHGTYEELMKFKHPIVDELKESIESLGDELTGLLSKELFKSRHALTSGEGNGSSNSAVLFFSIDFEILAESTGMQAAAEVIKTLGEYVNNYFSPLGGFSSRYGRDNIFTILPRVNIEEAGQLVHDFAGRLEQKSLAQIQAYIGKEMGTEECFEGHVFAGITGGRLTDDIEQLIEKALANKKVIATYKYDKKGELK